MRPASPGPVTPQTPACILYTSGTTGRPKGCVLSQGYEVAAGARYAALGGLAALRPGEDRIYNPLPLYHANAGVFSLMAAILTGNCQIQPDRFRPQRWWREIAETRATVVHYLGIIVPLLLGQAASADERAHQVRFAVGAGVEPELHSAAEARFGFPLIELWGMTEMVRVLADNIEPRHVGTRAFGRAIDGVEARVVDDEGRDVTDPQPGELLIRHSAATPRRGFFSGYLKDDGATELAWHGGWFHTGDMVWRGPDGMLHFVDRKKNIIRRSGENIAAAEVEAAPADTPGRAPGRGDAGQGRAARGGSAGLRRAAGMPAPGKEMAQTLVQLLPGADRLLQGARLDPFRGAWLNIELIVCAVRPNRGAHAPPAAAPAPWT